MEPSAPPEIVLVAHYDLSRVKALLAEDPALLNVCYAPWAETPLGAASHVGNRPIAEFLLSRGAPLTILAAAMLGMRQEVAAFLSSDPALANASGAHGISLLFHAALSGDVSIAEQIAAAGGSLEHAGHALHAAVSGQHTEMLSWLLAAGADVTVQDYQGRTPLQAAEAAGLESLADRLRTAAG